MKWEHFVSKLEPGQKETWTAVITGPDAKKAVAEMVAALYDQSLDAYLPHDWLQGFDVFRQDWSRLQLAVRELGPRARAVAGQLAAGPEGRRDMTYRSLPGEHHREPVGLQVLRRRQGRRPGQAAMLRRGRRNAAWRRRHGRWRPARAAARPAKRGCGKAEQMDAAGAAKQATGGRRRRRRRPPRGPDLGQVSARKNLNETAFFFPHLLADERRQGEAGIHHARGPDPVEVPRLRPRPRPAERAAWKTRW